MAGANGLYCTPYYRRFLIRWNSRGYATIADPFKIITINPNKITRVTGRGPNPGRFQWQDIGKIQDSDWDQNDERVENLPVVRALRQRFEHGEDWKEIDFIDHVLQEITRGNVIWRECASEQDVWAECSRIDDLYKNIRESGYRSQQKLVEEGKKSPDKYCDGDRFNCYDEVAVDIGREGEFLFVDGRHRLAIAKILDLDEIPVRVSARHEAWQQVRERTADTASNNLESRLNHPDLVDISP
ncbi:hypothetical protein AArcSl_2919 [Halalkaliarchaeum desulfuricum]|uniref:ParB/Sulfiredoxin domain-containing protein n=1 Tax=Halalkaliarchaeum desulfuricum TaxID=2055893 RepID=A0A343TN58_9EURY|nr:hypothetical protein [Halalkaliarchaeum desulfuricum]AUX10530.1 hypothetical protein AArcSl_2919 [Halalkaliarchaeum desulfuricum]